MCLIIVGEDVVSSSDSLSNLTTPQLTVYFSQAELPDGVSVDSESGEVSENLIYLGGIGQIKTAEGVTIAACTKYGENIEEKLKYAADILISSRWPTAVTNGTNAATTLNDFNSIIHEDSLVDAVKKTQPRYHFTISGPQKDVFWERVPYKWDTSKESQITRFISLGSFGSKAKWFYAFNIAVPDIPKPDPVGTTKVPFPTTVESTRWQQPKDRKRTRVESEFDFRNRRDNKRAAMKPVGPEGCFFCLSNPNLDKNLVVSIGDETYVALAKGPLTTPQILDNKIDFSGHALVLPLAHVPLWEHVPLESKDTVYVERQKYLVSLAEMFRSKGLSMVSFELSQSRGVHIHTQVVPIPGSISATLIEKEFKAEAQKASWVVYKRELSPDESEYFKISVPGEEKPLVIDLTTVNRFDFQFGRKVLARLLNAEKRVSWRECAQAPEEELIESNAFKRAFKDYDFTL
ncbi:CWF19-like protein Drn1p [Trichomonascus vanleenenianus]|uniref:Drn1p n=1 Tax=Trichomonascus vanleenenianus TaxID=2268995 RepID=UPI003EC9AC66